MSTSTNVPLQPVKSSNVKAVGWQNNILAIEFNGGGIYYYHDVPQDVYDKLLAAESIGKFIGACIKGKYEFTRGGVVA